MSRQRIRGGWARFNRMRRSLGFDRNRLRRRIDRVQWATGVAMMVLFLAAAPGVTALVVDHVYTSGVRAERADAARRAQSTPGRPKTGSDSTTSTTSTTSLSSKTTDERPRTHTDTIADSALTGLIAAAATGVPFLAGYLLVRRRLDRRRAASWDVAWTRLDQRHAA